MVRPDIPRAMDIGEPGWYVSVDSAEAVSASHRITSMIDGLRAAPSREEVVSFRRAVMILALIGRFDEIGQLCCEHEDRAHNMVKPRMLLPWRRGAG